MSRRRGRGIGVLSIGRRLLFVLAVWATHSASALSPIEFWTIEPNEGESAGGHSAIRIGEFIYHVEHRGDGLIADRRDPRTGFERVYRQLGNRAIDVLELELPPSVAVELELILRRRYFERKIELDRLADLEEDLGWMERGLARGHLGVAVPGLGLLTDGAGDCLDPKAASLLRRKQGIQEKWGAGWLEGRISRYRRALHLAIRATSEASLPGSASVLSEGRSGEGGVRRIVEAAQMVEALEAIRTCRAPETSRLVPVRFDSFKWAGEELDVWTAIGAQVESRFLRLLRSERSDAGLAILLAWGRLAAFDASLERGGVTLLDPLAEAIRDPSGGGVVVPAQWRAGHESEAMARLISQLRQLSVRSGPGLEESLFRVEVLLHRLGHARLGEIHENPDSEPRLRVTRATRHPSRIIQLPWPAGWTIGELEAGRENLADRVEVERTRLRSELGYRLFRRNCVTELLSAFDEALMADSSTAGFRHDRRRDPEAMFSFIPVVARRIVRRHLVVTGTRREQSWRESTLALEQQRGPMNLLSRVRESNTLSSTSYPANPRDSAFLFFSQSPVWMRPAFGIANLATGLGTSLVGALLAPFDRAAMARRGLNGVLMSIPEIFFFNVRKGSYPIVPPIGVSGSRRGASEDDGT